MDFAGANGHSVSSNPHNSETHTRSLHAPTAFDIFDWHPKFLACHAYFLDKGQYVGPVQAVASFLNIHLPFQRHVHPVNSSRDPTSAPSVNGGYGEPRLHQYPGPITSQTSRHQQQQQQSARLSASQVVVSLTPYIRRLVVTGFDNPGVLHGFFGDGWEAGIGPLHETERKNYLFAAKSDNWLRVKASYDMADGQTVPFMKPLQNVTEREILNAESSWSELLAMQDWMLGERAPAEVSADDRQQAETDKTDVSGHGRDVQRRDTSQQLHMRLPQDQISRHASSQSHKEYKMEEMGAMMMDDVNIKMETGLEDTPL